MSSLPTGGIPAALLVAGLVLLLALFDAGVTALSRRRGRSREPVITSPRARAAHDPVRTRRAAAVVRLILLAAIMLTVSIAVAAGLALPALVAVASLALLHLLEQQGRLRLFGARAGWLAGAAAALVYPFMALVPAGKRPGTANDDAAAADVIEDLADLLATAPEDRQQMVQALLGLEQRRVEDIMIPRSDVVGIDARADWEDIVELLARTPHTRLPLYDGDLERVIGVVHMKRVANEVAAGRLTRERLREIATQREAFFVPEGTSLQAQLIAFRKLKRRIGFVVDEYGDVLGLVTLEDILEEVVGEFTTQPAALHREVTPGPDGSFVVAGSAGIRAVNRALGWELPADGPRTLSGLIIEFLETIPEPGTSLKIADYAIEILQVGDNMVRTARLWPPGR